MAFAINICHYKTRVGKFLEKIIKTCVKVDFAPTIQFHSINERERR